MAGRHYSTELRIFTSEHASHPHCKCCGTCSQALHKQRSDKLLRGTACLPECPGRACALGAPGGCGDCGHTPAALGPDSGLLPARPAAMLALRLHRAYAVDSRAQ